MSPDHLVRRAAEARYEAPGGWATAASGYRRWRVVDESGGAVHTGFGVCALEPGGSVPAHVHSFEESAYVLDGVGVLDTAEGSFRLRPGDYALLPVGVAHAWRNDSRPGAEGRLTPGGAEPRTGDGVFRWAEMQGPVPRERFDGDTVLVPALPAREALAIDVRDPRTRRLGNITPAHMDAAKQAQSMLAVSASMRTALLLYGGITVKMMVDSDLGARLTTMFMVQYDPDGAAGPHDHPFEETYMFLEGTVDATFDGERYRLEAGDVAWAGVGCVHGFANAGGGPLRWLETQSPQPPGRHSYRFVRDWAYLRERLGGERS
ncbi:MAG TPA: cupin domain-containing protein [Micromonosporaceae bacterium]|jgi:quercetin dioxygenase-like cupin family protein|nr:cupin domain-containing protein [Micromonosporaceae bacterium]